MVHSCLRVRSDLSWFPLSTEPCGILTTVFFTRLTPVPCVPALSPPEPYFFGKVVELGGPGYAQLVLVSPEFPSHSQPTLAWACHGTPNPPRPCPLMCKAHSHPKLCCWRAAQQAAKAKASGQSLCWHQGATGVSSARGGSCSCTGMSRGHAASGEGAGGSWGQALGLRDGHPHYP